MSQLQISHPTEAQYRTVPLPPTNVTFDRNTITPYSFDVQWRPPKSLSEFDRYQVSLGVRHALPKVVLKNEPRIAHFSEDLEPGKTYEVVVKTVSGNVASWPVTGNITTRPLPVIDLTATTEKVSDITLKWSSNNESIQDSYMVRYHELEAFNSDGSVQVVQDTHVHLENLLAGRNYSIAVFAVSKGVNSEETVIYQPTKPASPVIGILEPISGRTFNVSWKSDVTSRQDSYKVVWIRNDTKERKEFVTKNNWLILDNLYPGAGYEILVSAISYGLVSEPHTYFQTVSPRPPEGLQIMKNSNSTIILNWLAPIDSLVDHYVVRYRAVESNFWREMGTYNTTSVEFRNLIAGERYMFRVSAVSNKAEAPDIREIEQTMYPNPISDVRSTLDSQNITFQWTVPSGRIDYYNIVFNTVREPTKQESKQIPSLNTTAVGETMSVLIDSLKPGELYSFRFYTISHKFRSEGIGVQLRTCEFEMCKDVKHFINML